MPFTEQGAILNEKTGFNPKELDDFQYTMKWVYPNYISTTSWTAQNLPKGLQIDTQSGLITGKIKGFTEQPSTSSMIAPDNPLKENCENYLEIGQSTLKSFAYTFVVTHNFIYGQSTPTGIIPTPMVETATFIITLFKNNSIDNNLLVKKYYKSGWEIKGYVDAQDYINNSPCAEGTFIKE